MIMCGVLEYLHGDYLPIPESQTTLRQDTGVCVCVCVCTQGKSAVTFHMVQ